MEKRHTPTLHAALATAEDVEGVNAGLLREAQIILATEQRDVAALRAAIKAADKEADVEQAVMQVSGQGAGDGETCGWCVG